MKAQKIMNGLLSLAGFDTEIVHKCVNKTRYYGIAISMLIPALLSGISVFYMVSIYNGSLIAKIIASILAFVMMLLIESIAMRGFKPTDSVANNFLSLGAFTRIGLVAANIFFFSGIIELKIAESEIEKELVVMKQNEIKTLKSQSRDKKVNLTDRTNKEEDKAKALYEDFYEKNVAPAENRYDKSKGVYRDEIDGNAASGKEGIGPIAEAKKVIMVEDSMRLVTVTGEYNRLRSMLDTIAHQKQESIKQINADLEEDISSLKSSFSTGIFARKEALDNVKQKNAAVWWQGFFLSMLLVFMDMIGLVSKFTLKKTDEYYLILDTIEGNNLQHVNQSIADELTVKKLQDKKENEKQLQDLHLALYKDEIEFNKNIAELESESKVGELQQDVTTVLKYGEELEKSISTIKYKDKGLEKTIRSVIDTIADNQLKEFISK